MHSPRQTMTPPSLATRVQVYLGPGRRGRAYYDRVPPLELQPRSAPWSRKGQGPGGRFPLGTYQRAAGYALQTVGPSDPLREVKVHTRALAAEALVQVHANTARRSLRRLHFSNRQISQLLRAARRPQPMRGATPVFSVIDEVPNGTS